MTTITLPKVPAAKTGPTLVAKGAYPSDRIAKAATGAKSKAPAPKAPAKPAAKTKTPAKAKVAAKPAKAAPKTAAPKTGDLAAAIAKAGLTAKKARARFRRAGLNGPYTLNAETKKALGLNS